MQTSLLRQCGYGAARAQNILSPQLFVTTGAGHEFADGLFRAFVVVEDGVHLLGDGHLNFIAGSEAKRGVGAADAFSYLAVETGEDFGKLTAAAEFDADGAIAGERSGAGEDEIADAGETGKCLAPSTAGYGKPSHLSDTARDEGGGGVVTKVEAVGDTGGEGNDIFQ